MVMPSGFVHFNETCVLMDIAILLYDGWAVGRKSREKKIENTNNKNLYVSWLFIYWAIKYILT